VKARLLLGFVQSWAWLLCLLAGGAYADIFKPAYLELRESGDDSYDVVWRVPALDETTRPALDVRFPAGTRNLTEPRATFVAGVRTELWRVHRPGGLVGQSIRITGHAITVSDVIARVERSDGSSQTTRLPVDDPHFTVEAATGTGAIAWTYLALGVEHILGGLDHLLFVLALLLIVRGGRRILATITAFTLAHSITLAAATLGWLHVPGPPVEAIIALSIVFVAAEVVHGLRGRPGLTARAPWVVAFSFGLLHGLGFASALAEVGLPQNAIPVALLMFNVGVELGQLTFVAGVLTVIAGLRRLPVTLSARAAYLPPYAIGLVAMFWVFERVASFLG
jgi:hydrogenase/urease accessory protein HupE